MSRSMTPDELIMLFALVHDKHNVHNSSDNVKIVKYLTPVFDNRTGDIFSIQIRGYGWKKSIYISNEEQDNPCSLYDRCVTFLTEPYKKPKLQFEVGDTVILEGGELMSVEEVNNSTEQVKCQWFENRTVHEQWFDYDDVKKLTDEEVENFRKQFLENN